ncbi:hypothetical protein GOB20_24825 [Sinorhizobium meliloti]|nr:hypothetical protein [Sinorhizobium meliloti]
MRFSPFYGEKEQAGTASSSSSRGRRRGWELAACPFAPLAGRRCRQADEGLSRIPLSAALRLPHPTRSGFRSASASA